MASNADDLAALIKLPDSGVLTQRRSGCAKLVAAVAATAALLFLAAGVPAAFAGPAAAQAGASDPSQLVVGAEVEFQTGSDMPTYHRGTIITPPKETSPGFIQAEIMAAPSADFPQDNGEIWERVDLIRAVNAADVDTKPADWFMGGWNLAVSGATVDRVGSDGNVYRQEEGGTGLGQALVINSDGTYLWQAQPDAAPIGGNWRAANADEPGARIVLLAGESGSDWIVYANSVHAPGDHIKLIDASASVRYGARAN